MKTKITFLLIILVVSLKISAQDQNYLLLVKKADSLYILGKYAEATEAFDVALENINSLPVDLYNAACTHSLNKNFNAAFYYLYRAINTGYSNRHLVITDPDLYELRKNRLNEWKDFNDFLEYKFLNIPIDVASKLKNIRKSDQIGRFNISRIRKRHGKESSQYKRAVQHQLQVDSLNYLLVSILLDTIHPDSLSLLSEQFHTIFYVVHHAKPENRLEHLELMKWAYQNKLITNVQWTEFQDRTSLFVRGCQLYGSQFFRDDEKVHYKTFCACDSVDILRSNFGLPPIEEHANKIGVVNFNLLDYCEQNKLVPSQNFQLNEYLTNTYASNFIKIWGVDKKPRYPETVLYDRNKRIAYVSPIKKGEISINESTFQLGVIDANSNDNYNDAGIDNIILFPKEIDSMRVDLMYAAITYYEHDMCLSIDDKLYHIDNLSKNGEDISLRQTDSVSTKNCLVFNSFLPSLELITIENKTENLRQLHESTKYTLIDIWHAHCGGCLKSFPILKDLLINNKSKLNIIGLNPIDDPEAVNEIVLKHNLSWNNFLCQKDDIPSFGIDNWFPSYILYNQEMQLISNTMDLNEVIRIINEN